MSVWNSLTSEAQLDELREASFSKPQLIFKHSVSCGISGHVRQYLEDSTEDLQKPMDLHYLDLLRYRSVSNAIASTFQVPHQSPQVIVVKNGEVIHTASHMAIRPESIISKA